MDDKEEKVIEQGGYKEEKMMEVLAVVEFEQKLVRRKKLSSVF